MSYLQWELDTEDGLDAHDPLGNISIIGDEGKLEEKCTYIDAFLEALVEGVEQMEVGKTINIDPLVEPNDLEFDCTSNVLKINYGNQQVTISNPWQFAEDVQKVIEELIEVLDELADKANQSKRKLFKLRQYRAISKPDGSYGTASPTLNK